MTPIADADLDPPAIEAIEAALGADPELAVELEAIDAALRPAARARFWRALAAELPRHARPAAAVLAALELTATPER
jgi:hypothetical protein